MLVAVAAWSGGSAVVTCPCSVSHVVGMECWECDLCNISWVGQAPEGVHSIYGYCVYTLQ